MTPNNYRMFNRRLNNFVNNIMTSQPTLASGIFRSIILIVIITRTAIIAVIGDSLVA